MMLMSVCPRANMVWRVCGRLPEKIQKNVAFIRILTRQVCNTQQQVMLSCFPSSRLPRHVTPSGWKWRDGRPYRECGTDDTNRADTDISNYYDTTSTDITTGSSNND